MRSESVLVQRIDMDRKADRVSGTYPFTVVKQDEQLMEHNLSVELDIYLSCGEIDSRETKSRHQDLVLSIQKEAYS